MGGVVHATSALPKKQHWLHEIVAVKKDGAVVTGLYDGYGRCELGSGDVVELNLDSDTVYHRQCWELAGKPTDYRGPTPYALDQGFFIDSQKYIGCKPSAGSDHASRI